MWGKLEMYIVHRELAVDTCDLAVPYNPKLMA